MSWFRKSQKVDETELDFVSAADRIERKPIARGLPVTLYLLLAGMATGLAWAGLSRVDEVVTARGRLISTDTHLVLQPSESAQIESIKASVGQFVRKGEVLVVFDSTNVGADLGQVRDRLRSLDAQVRRLEAERDGRAFVAQPGDEDASQRQIEQQRAANHKARLDRFSESLARARKGLEFNASEIKALEDRLAALREIETMNEDLVAKQFQSRRSLLDTRERRLDADRTLASARSRTNELRQELAALEADRAAYVAEYSQRLLEELVTARRERDALAQQVVKADRRSTLNTLAAPVDGTVLEVAKVAKGSVVREAQALVTIVPQDASVEAEVRVENADVAGVKEGDAVRVKIDAFPFQRHGILEGRVRKLSPDTPSEQPPSGPAQPPGQYLARVEIDSSALRARDRAGKLIPGMTLTAEILTGQRTVLSYLTDPLVRMQHEALTER
jgi:hemolysin D